MASGQFREIKSLTQIVHSVAFSPNSRIIASGCDDNTIRSWNFDIVPSRELNHSAFVQCFGFSPDSRTLATGSDDNTIRLWNLKSGQCREWKGHRNSVTQIQFSLDGCWLASGSADQTIRLWEIATGQCRELTGHQGKVTNLEFSPDCRRLLSRSNDKTARIWDVVNGKSLTVPDDFGYSIIFRPDGHQFTTEIGEDGKLRIWSAVHFTLIREIAVPVSSSQTLPVWVGDKIGLTIEGKDWLYDIATGERSEGVIPKATFASNEISPNGRWLAENFGNTIRLIDLPERQGIQEQSIRQNHRRDADWHRQQAYDSATSKNWFAAMFHSRRGLELDREDVDAQLWIAYLTKFMGQKTESDWLLAEFRPQNSKQPLWPSNFDRLLGHFCNEACVKREAVELLHWSRQWHQGNKQIEDARKYRIAAELLAIDGRTDTDARPVVWNVDLPVGGRISIQWHPTLKRIAFDEIRYCNLAIDMIFAWNDRNRDDLEVAWLAAVRPLRPVVAGIFIEQIESRFMYAETLPIVSQAAMCLALPLTGPAALKPDAKLSSFTRTKAIYLIRMKKYQDALDLLQYCKEEFDTTVLRNLALNKLGRSAEIKKVDDEIDPNGHPAMRIGWERLIEESRQPKGHSLEELPLPKAGK